MKNLWVQGATSWTSTTHIAISGFFAMLLGLAASIGWGKTADSIAGQEKALGDMYAAYEKNDFRIPRLGDFSDRWQKDVLYAENRCFPGGPGEFWLAFYTYAKVMGHPFRLLDVPFQGARSAEFIEITRHEALKVVWDFAAFYGQVPVNPSLYNLSKGIPIGHTRMFSGGSKNSGLFRNGADLAEHLLTYATNNHFAISPPLQRSIERLLGHHRAAGRGCAVVMGLDATLQPSTH